MTLGRAPISRVLALAIVAGTILVPGGAALYSGAPSSSLPSAAVTVFAGPTHAAGALTSGASVAIAPARPSADPATLLAGHALSEARAHGVPVRDVFVPRPSATPSQLAAARAAQVVSPAYSTGPAPIGLAYYGLSAGVGNTVVGSILNTTRLKAEVDANATGVLPLDLMQSSPDGYGIQLNAVTTKITLLGQAGFAFWTQNVVLYYPTSHELVLVSNIWNFSSSAGGFTGHELLYNGISGGNSDGPNGTANYAALGLYYGEKILPTPFTYPFNLTLYLNSTVVDQRNAISFGVHITGPSEHYGNAAWDYAIFNSVRPAGSPVSVPSNYTANGRAYNALGLTNDFELTFGGPGGGSHATLFRADAALGLAYYSGASFVPVPAAYSYGGETGETATGAHVAWSSAPGGPAGLARYGTMSTGPSYLVGLWNATAPAGSFPLTITANPVNAFSLLTQLGPASPFTDHNAELAPGGLTHTYYLIPGNYSVLTELSGYAASTNVVDLTGAQTLYVNLTSNPSLGVYTPLWAFSNGQLASLASSGSGTASAPYEMPSSQPSAIASAFGLYNDFGYPVYPAVLFYGTTAAAQFLHPPSFSTLTSTMGGGSGLPSSNDPPYWFWNASNVSIVGAANISGWFAGAAFSPLFSNTFSIVFYEGGHDLVANNTFDSQAGGLLLYSGGSPFAPGAIGGGNVTVWGNTFREVKSPTSPAPLTNFSSGLGLEVAEAGDTIYDNSVNTPTTAWLLPANLYTGNAATFSDRWNITREPASDVAYASGFPTVPLTGSILGTNYQGGNFWWDFGLSVNHYNGARNPYTKIPYTEAGTTPIDTYLGGTFYSASYIHPGGDYVPLVSGHLVAITFQPSPVTVGPSWGVDVWNAQHAYFNASSNGSALTVLLSNGTYWYRGAGSPTFPYVGPKNLTLTVAGVNVTLPLQFRTPSGDRTILFTEAGLPRGHGWTVSVRGTSGPTDANNATASALRPRLMFANTPGAYTFSVVPIPGYVVNSPSGAANDTAAGVVIHLHFRPYLSTVTFTETGLINGSSWAITVGGKAHGSTHPSINVSLANGSYAYFAHPKTGYRVVGSGNVSVVGSALLVNITFTRVTYNVTFSESGLLAGTNWSVTVGALTLHALAPASIVFHLPNGTAAFTIGPVTGFHATPSSGTVHVAAGPASVSVTFAPGPAAATPAAPSGARAVSVVRS